MSEATTRKTQKNDTTAKVASPTATKTPSSSGKKFKLLFVFAGFGAVIGLVAGLVAFLARPQTEPVETITGSVLSINGEPIDGAFILAADDAVQSMPDGSFTIDASKNETLSVSAFGYESATAAAGAVADIRLNPIATTVVRVVVTDENNLAAERAMVFRLDTNTGKPISTALTDKTGSAIFPEVPADQALFVVMHPEAGIGWVELALAPGEVYRPTVRLQKVEGSVQPISKGLVKKAYAQSMSAEELDRWYNEKEEYRLLYELTKDEDKFIGEPQLDIESVGDKRFRIYEKTKTIIDMNYHPGELELLIDDIEINAQFPNFELSKEVQQKIYDKIAEESLTPPFSSVRVTFQPSQVRYNFDGKYNELTYDETKVFEIELQPPIPGGSKAVIERELATPVSREVRAPGNINTSSIDIKPVVVTGWAEAEMAQLVGAHYVYPGGSPNGDPPHMTVCCRRPAVEGGASGEVPSITTSTDTTPNGFNFTDFARKADFYFQPILRDNPPDWDAVDELMVRNPGLEFTDRFGQKFSLNDIGPPDPQDAPSEFLHDYFEKPSEAAQAFAHDPGRYSRIWSAYVLNTATSLFQHQGIPPSEFRDLLTNMIEANRQRRFDPLGFESGTGAASSMSQAVEDAAGSESQPPETDESDESGETEDTTSPEGDSQTSGGVAPQTPPTNAGCPEGSTFTCSR